MERLEMEILSERVMQDGGISLPLRLPGGRHIRWVMRVPTYASLLNIGRMYLKLGVRYDEVKEYDFEQKVEFITRHGVGVSRMGAYPLPVAEPPRSLDAPALDAPGRP